ncbi:MAG TPA: phosphomannomutase/phosphoglucomutase [Candidatus Saccharimonadales bacterium]|nr:phosphomannomutase/phosphoglucomutase [Candidatus Saccharimonadales bacterium]
MNLDIFKAYDVRGKVGEDLTPEVAERLGRALATWLPTAGAVVVGRDIRTDSAQLAEAFINGVRQQGRDVWDLGQITSDMMYFCVGKFGLAGGAMITSGHIHSEYNGLRFCHEQARPIGVGEGLMNIRDLVVSNQFVSPPQTGQVIKKDIADDWIEHVLSFADLTKWPKYRVAIDTGNGAAGPILQKIATKLPLQIFPMYFDPDPSFPNHPADPLNGDNLTQIKAKISIEACDFGFAFDADGDHALMLDEQGEVVTGKVITAILATYLLGKNPGATILYNLICGQTARDAIVAAGGKPFRTRVGFGYIKADMRTQKALFAGEHTAHLYFKDNFYTDSGLIGMILSIQALAESGEKLSDLANKYRNKYVSSPEINFEVENKPQVIERVRATFTDGAQDLLDGITVAYEDQGKWFNVRPSNTEPVLRLNAEAKSQQDLDELINKVTKIIEE